MEKELNIAAILKEKPKGTKLYSTPFGECTFDGVTNDDDICFLEQSNSPFCTDGYGKYSPNGECLIFPSIQMTNWSKFAWKKGDVLVSNDGGTEVIFDKWYDDTYTSFYGKHYLDSENENNIRYLEGFICTTERYFLEFKDASQTYINTIEKRLGGKLNLETLKIEKQPEFKDGDIVAFGQSVAICKKFENDKLYFYACIEAAWGLILSDSVNTSLEYRLATDSEKQQLFETLAKENKVWDAKGKQIVDLPKKCKLKAFDKVLVKIAGRTWTADFFSHYDENDEALPYVCIGYGRVTHCIPYNEETKHLLGTTDEWKESEE